MEMYASNILRENVSGIIPIRLLRMQFFKHFVTEL